MLEHNTSSGEVKWKLKIVARLSKSESLILNALLNNLNHFSSKDDLIEIGWPQKYVSQNSLAVAIKKIRKVLQETNGEFKVETIYGRGYLLRGEQSKIQPCVGTPHAFNKSVCEVGRIKASDEVNEEPTFEHTIDSGYFIKKSTFQVARKFFGFLKKTMLLLYVSAIITLSTIYFLSSGELYCYKLNNRTEICGVFELNKAKITLLEKKTANMSGVFLYGYKKSSKEIVLYNID